MPAPLASALTNSSTLPLKGEMVHHQVPLDETPVHEWCEERESQNKNSD